MIRVFNSKRTRRLEAAGDPNDFMTLKAYAFADVPDKYTGDITFAMGLKCGEIEIIETRKQADAVEAKAEKEKENRAEEPVEVEVEGKPVKKSRSKK